MYQLTDISKTRKIKRQSLSEYCPAPYNDLACRDLACRSNYCYFSLLTSTKQSLIKCPQWIITSYATQCAHIQKMTYMTVSLTRDTRSFVDTFTTLVRLGIKTIIGYYRFACPITICQHMETVHGYKKMRTELVAYSWNCLEILDLFFEMRMNVNMILDGVLKYLYLFLKVRYVILNALLTHFVAYIPILLRFQAILFRTKHPIKVIKPIQYGLKLCNFLWQWFPKEWLLDCSEMSKHHSVLFVCLCSLTYPFYPISHRD